MPDNPGIVKGIFPQLALLFVLGGMFTTPTQLVTLFFRKKQRLGLLGNPKCIALAPVFISVVMRGHVRRLCNLTTRTLLILDL